MRAYLIDDKYSIPVLVKLDEYDRGYRFRECQAGDNYGDIQCNISDWINLPEIEAHGRFLIELSDQTCIQTQSDKERLTEEITDEEQALIKSKKIIGSDTTWVCDDPALIYWIGNRPCRCYRPKDQEGPTVFVANVTSLTYSEGTFDTSSKALEALPQSYCEIDRVKKIAVFHHYILSDKSPRDEIEQNITEASTGLYLCSVGLSPNRMCHKSAEYTFNRVIHFVAHKDQEGTTTSTLSPLQIFFHTICCYCCSDNCNNCHNCNN